MYVLIHARNKVRAKLGKLLARRENTRRLRKTVDGDFSQLNLCNFKNYDPCTFIF